MNLGNIVRIAPGQQSRTIADKPAAPMCHFEYFPPPINTLYLDGPAGLDNYIGGHSVVGSGGSTLTNADPNDPTYNPHNYPANCTIYAGSSSSIGKTDPNSPNIFDLTLSIGFTAGSQFTSPTYMYEIVENKSGYWSGGAVNNTNTGTWNYWGYWYIP